MVRIKEYLTLFAIAVVAGLCAWRGLRFSRAFPETHFKAYRRRASRRIYEQVWRRDALDFLSRARMPYRTFCELLNSQASRYGGVVTWFARYATEDRVLEIYAEAVRHAV